MQKEYGVTCISGNFGAGKTFWTFLNLFALDKDEYFIIANVPYSCVDIFFSTTDELVNVLKVLDYYVQETNWDLQLLYKSQPITKKIIFVLDESQNEMWAREALTKANLIKEFKPTLTQCRKRRIKMFFITQRLTQIDIYIRRLSDFVLEYRKRRFFGAFRTTRSLYENIGDVAQIETDDSVRYIDWEAYQTFKERALMYSDVFRHHTRGIRNLVYCFYPIYQKIAKEKHLSLYVVGYEDPNTDEVDLDILQKGLVRSESTIFKFNQKQEKKAIKKAKLEKIKNWFRNIKTKWELRNLKKDTDYYKEELIEDLHLWLEENGSNSWKQVMGDRESLDQWKSNLLLPKGLSAYNSGDTTYITYLNSWFDNIFYSESYLKSFKKAQTEIWLYLVTFFSILFVGYFIKSFLFTLFHRKWAKQ